MKQNIIFITGLSLLSGVCVAQSVPIAPQPTDCIDSSFLTMQRSKYAVGQTVALTVTNHCGQNINLQNSSITFLNTKNVNAVFWGNFFPLSYPTNTDMRITSQPHDDQYLSTLSLQYDAKSNAKTTLPDGGSFTIYYTVKQASYIDDSVKVYLNSAVNTGNIRIINNTPQPENIGEFYTMVNISLNGEIISQVPLPWSGEQLISGLAPGEYDISPINISSEDEGHQYEGSGPGKLIVTSGGTASAYISYTEKLVMGSISLKLQDLPNELAGYGEKPTVTLVREDNNSAQITDVSWGTIYETSRLAANKVQYHFSTPDITYNGYTCSPSFDPAVMTTKSNNPIVSLNYSCIKTAQDNVRLRITGAPMELSSVTVRFIPNGHAEPITQIVELIAGEGSSLMTFTEGGIYTVSADALEGYATGYSSQLLTVSDGAEEIITYAKAEPLMTAPVVVDTTEPTVVTEPEVTAPVVVDTTEPAVVTEPEVTAPVVVDTTEPAVVTEPEVTAPVVVDTTEPAVVTEPEVTAPVVVDTTEPAVVTEPEVTAPVVVDTTEPAVVTEPEVTAPVVVDTTEPAVVTEEPLELIEK